jgi:protein-disulfide isomerase
MAQPAGGMKGFYLALGAIALGGLGLLGYQLMKPGSVSIPANVAVLAADTAGFRGYVLGSDSAPVEITEYGDYQCPGCANFELVQFPDIKTRLIDAGKLRWRYRDFPLDDIHPNARISAHAAACADEQGKFWPVHNLIFQGQSDWAFGNAQKVLRGYAEAAQLDLAGYDGCMQAARYAGRIEASLQEGTALGVTGTPTFLVAGRFLGAREGNFDRIRRLVDSLTAAGQP